METTRCAAGLVDSAAVLWHDLRALAHDRLELASLEAQRAGEALAFMVACSVVIGILVATAWLAIIGAITCWLISSGMALAAALPLAALFSLASAFACARAIRYKSRDLRFPATLQSLQPRGANLAVQAGA